MLNQNFSHTELSKMLKKEMEVNITFGLIRKIKNLI